MEVRLPQFKKKNFKVTCDGRVKFFESMDDIIDWIFSEECPDSEHVSIQKLH
jgi:hypothetical protein